MGTRGGERGVDTLASRRHFSTEMNVQPPRAPTQREQDLFFAALERPDPATRRTFLDVECADDPALRHWIENELRKELRGAGNSLRLAAPLETTSISREVSTPHSPEVESLLRALKPDEAGEQIGVYTLLERLGEGGFGAVWMAEQALPVHRRVALKIIRLGMNSEEVIARFAQERQALALMDHPGIAKVFDAGATAFGRPYFVMELVDGTPIHEYCDQERLTVRERLEMFMQVCYAVQHAHQKGIIHRDLKPNNVLVTRQDGLPVPKVIDFGIAKATEQGRLAGSTLVTRNESMVGTPLYMSPEQVGSGGEDIDTRSDIYALGVLLYALLTGRTPLDAEAVNQAGFEEMIRLIREQEAPSPTTALRLLSSDELSEAAAQRQIGVPRLLQTVRGDLEWICLKALEKDRRRRYASAASFAADVQHFLLNEPVSASPPSRWYRIQKLAMRNRSAFTAAAVILVTVLAGIVVSVTDTIHARASERNAVAAEQAEAEQRRQAEGDRTWAEREQSAARLSAYIADVGFAGQSILDGNLGRATQLLARQRPTGNETDLREFGWRYLWQLCRGDEHGTFPDLEGPAAALAFSPDGALLAIGGLEEVVVCDAHTHRKLTTLKPGAGSLAFLADGGTLVTIARGRLHLWRAADWQEIGSWPEGPGPLALSSDGTRLAVVTRDGVRVRDTATWKETRFLPGVGSPIAFAPDGKSLAGILGGSIALQRLDNGKGLTLENSTGLFNGDDGTFFRPIQAITFTPDGTRVAAPQNWLSERGIFLLRSWDARTGREVSPAFNDPARPEHTGLISSLAFSPDGHTAVTTSLDHTVCLWDWAHHLPVTRLQGHLAEVGGSAFSPDGHTLVTCDRLGHVYSWALGRGKEDDDLPNIVQVLGYGKDGHTMAALTTEQTVVFYDEEKTPRRRIELDPTTMGAEAPVAVSSDLQTLAQGLDGGRVKIWRTDTGESHILYVSDHSVELLVLSADGQTLITGSRGEHLRMDRLDTGGVTSLPFSARRVLLAPDGRTLALVSTRDPAFTSDEHRPMDGPVGRGGPGGGRTLKPLAPYGPTTHASVADLVPGLPATGAPVVNGLPLWDLENNVLRTKLNVPVSDVLDGAFSPNGRLFATAVSDNTVQLWDPSTGVLIGTCAGHKQVVNAVAFAHDGRTLASASEDGTLRLWNVTTQQELLAILALGERTTDLLFSPDDQALVAASQSRSEPRRLRFYRAPATNETNLSAENGKGG